MLAGGPWECPDGHVVVEIGLVDDRLLTFLAELVERLMLGGVLVGASPDGRTGRREAVAAVVDNPACLVAATFGDLRTAAAGETGDGGPVSLAVRSPLQFRSGDSRVVHPTPGRVFGRLRALWNTFGPPRPPIGVDFTGCDIRVATDGVLVEATGVTPNDHRRAPANGVGHRGFLGTVRFDPRSGSWQDRRDLHALGRLAEFAGIGSATTRGFGAVKYLDATTT